MPATNGSGSGFKPDFLAYNTRAMRPVEVAFNISPEEMESIIREIASNEISGIESVDHYPDKSTGGVVWVIWFRSTSEHFIDRSTTSTGLGREIHRYSSEFQKFAQKFGYSPADDDPVNGSPKVNLGKIIHKNGNPEASGGKMIGLHVAIIPFLAVLMDLYGNAYRKEFNEATPKVVIDRKYIWTTDNDGHYKSFAGIQVKKYLANAFRDRRKPALKLGGKFNYVTQHINAI